MGKWSRGTDLSPSNLISSESGSVGKSILLGHGHPLLPIPWLRQNE